MTKRVPSSKESSFISSSIVLLAILVSIFFVFWLLRTPDERLGLAYQSLETSDKTKTKKQQSPSPTSWQQEASRPIAAGAASQAPASSNQAIAIDTSETTMFSEVQSLSDSASIQESAAMLDAMQAKDPSNERILFERAILASREQDDPALAKGLLEKILEQNPAQIEAADELFYTYKMTGDLEGALKKIKEIEAKSNAQQKQALDYVLGRLLMESGHPAEAKAHLEEAVAAGAHQACVREQLARAYGQAGQYEKAREIWENLDQDEVPSYSSLNAKSKLAEILQAEGKHEQAEAKVNELLALAPGHPEGLDLLQKINRGRQRQ